MLQRMIAQRPLIGILALIGFVVGSILCVVDARQQGAVGGSLLRAGLVLGTLWLALPVQWNPNAKRLTIWQGLPVLLSVMILVRKPVTVIVLLGILGFLNLFARRRT